MNKITFKSAKKLLTISMASSILLTSTQMVFATNNDLGVSINTTDELNTPTTNITITEAKGSEYKAYRLLDLENNGDAYKYSINNDYREIIVEVIQELDSTINVDSDSSIIEYLEGLNGKPEDIRAFADKVYLSIKDGNKESELTTTTGKFETTTQGYYLVAETGKIKEGTDRTLVMLDTLGQTSIEIKEKRGVPTLDKVIVENNNDVEHTDAGLNEIVTFKVTGSMPENIENYETYKYVIHDRLPEGLTYDSVTSIRIGDKNISDSDLQSFVKTQNQDCKTPNCSIEFSFDDIKETAKGLGVELKANTQVVVIYNVKVNVEAIIGNPGNVNEAHLEFSNDPYDNGSTGETPPDDAKVFSFSIVVNKVDKDKNKLSGAEFHLEKWDGEQYVAMTADNVESRVEDNGTKFTFETLDVGKYMLVEDKAPTGYNKADNLLFEIKAEYGKDTTTGEDVITRLYAVDENGNELGDLFSVSTDSDLGTLSTDIVNTTGIKLPSTGSTGAIMVYCASGIALTIGVASLVIARKKKNI